MEAAYQHLTNMNIDYVKFAKNKLIELHFGLLTANVDAVMQAQLSDEQNAQRLEQQHLLLNPARA